MRALHSLSAITLAVLTGLGAPSQAQTLGAPFASDYQALSLGSVPGLLSNYGGLAFLDANTIVIGGQANTALGSLYTIGVVRDTNNHVSGFSGTVSRFGGASGTVGEYNDGGVTYGPGGVLFTSRWPINGLGQTRPGSTDEDKVIELAPLGVANSHAAINFVPAGFGGAGQAKLVSWAGGEWYSATLSPDGSGTFDLNGVVRIDLDPLQANIQNLPGGPEGFVYIAAGNAAFATNSLLVSEFSAGQVAAYELDASGNPLVATRRSFLTGLTGAEGAVIDPLTGDFLFSTFGGGSRVVRVSGFLAPPPIPEPSTSALALLGLSALAVWRRARQRG